MDDRNTIAEFVADIDEKMQTKYGTSPMDEETLRVVTRQVMDATMMGKIRSGQVTADSIAAEAAAAIKSMGKWRKEGGFIEGGLINDSTGAGTQQIRNNLMRQGTNIPGVPPLQAPNQLRGPLQVPSQLRQPRLR